jgi:hypothetical protein
MVILLIQDVKHQITHWEWTMNKLKNNHYGVYFVMNFRVVTLIRTNGMRKSKDARFFFFVSLLPRKRSNLNKKNEPTIQNHNNMKHNNIIIIRFIFKFVLKIIYFINRPYVWYTHYSIMIGLSCSYCEILIIITIFFSVL